jgi:glycosyltransferase involved in cell wall biosynthesis
MNVAIAHEWLVRYAGSERVVMNLLEAFPGSRLLTTVVAPERLPEPLRAAEPSFLQHLPGAVNHNEYLLPLLPAAWALRRSVSDVDLVISSSHSCAKAVRVDSGIPHLCYCHTPMRYAWHFEQEKLRLPAPLRLPARPAMAAFRRWDAGTAKRVTRFVANSTAVAERISRWYGRPADVVHPPVRTDFFTVGEPRARDGFLFVGRLVSYKRPDIVVEAFRGLPYGLTVVGEGHLLEGLRREAPPNVRFLTSVDDDELRDLYRSSQALVFPGVEDFGIVMAEAQASGLPVIASAEGGARDIVSPGRTGILLQDVTVESVRRAVDETARSPFDSEAVADSARSRFSEERFQAELRRIAEELV